ncbi:MAG: ribosomal protein L11 methyltransferase [Patiriisocius sp.]|jgi:ribosomal protein L11 methyltransferase
MNYIAAHLKVTPPKPGSEILISLLSEIGFESFIETEDGLDAFIPVGQFDRENFIDTIGSDFFTTQYSIEEIEHTNWNKMWEEQYEPVFLAENCIIRAPFHELERKYEYEIVIQPQMSFGTGHHPTTALMVKTMLNLDLVGKEILDMGSGTGVLAVLAEKLGAKRVLAIEIDSHASQNCKDNVELNNCIHIDVENGDSAMIKGGKFDVIFANINLNVLLNDLELYVESLREGGQILLSGFYNNDEEQLIEPLKRLGLLEHSAKYIEHWTLLHFQKVKG